ncbi:hypothetical protein QR680_010489 [Steinernema hermaphroditum]|uniref:Uncharacterized protein n=1 Tax=Steinernema hermaphroditum TaxID=289476 RepID=A0AA39IP91_9BILA|nr:hypothetical protein QR680_010485 [Steinernema hermaphroditum]KAK0427926.1 hypothetical protein QR680_010489 [Steinernema hermaphroditum]
MIPAVDAPLRHFRWHGASEKKIADQVARRAEKELLLLSLWRQKETTRRLNSLPYCKQAESYRLSNLRCHEINQKSHYGQNLIVNRSKERRVRRPHTCFLQEMSS